MTRLTFADEAELRSAGRFAGLRGSLGRGRRVDRHAAGQQNRSDAAAVLGADTGRKGFRMWEACV